MQSFEIGDCISDDDDDDNHDYYGNSINEDEYNDDDNDDDNNQQQGLLSSGRTRRQERRQQRRANRQQKIQQLYQLRKSQLAIDRIRKYNETQNKIQLQQHERLIQFDINMKSKGRTLLKSLGSIIQKVNIGNWIDELEVQQEIKDKHDRNVQEEKDRQKIMDQAHEACINSIKEHLYSFLKEYNTTTTTANAVGTTLNVTTTNTTSNPESAIEPIHVDTTTTIGDTSTSSETNQQSQLLLHHPVTYEDWINELHPDNIITKKDGSTQLDERYYLIDSDHRLLWNEQIQLIEQQQQQLQQQSHATTGTSPGPSTIASTVTSSRIVQPRSMI